MINNFKLVILGKENIGKSSVIHRYIHNNFKNEHIATIGAQFTSLFPKKFNGKIKLEIWDTAGQERYRSIVPMYYKNSSIIMIMFDITNINSFYDAKYWMEQILDNTYNNPLIILVGNKKDLEEKRTVSMNEAKIYAKSNNIEYYEISALSGYGVNSTFENIINKTYIKFESTINNNINNNIIVVNDVKQRKCCY